MNGFTTRSIVLFGALVCGGVARAEMVGYVYNEGDAPLPDLATAASIVNSSGATATFTSNLVNGGFSYAGNDGDTNATWLGADKATLTPAAAATNKFESSVIDLRGYISVQVAGLYTFSTTEDDGGSFYIDGDGTSGSGTPLASVDGTHPPQSNSQTFGLSANVIYPIEYIYYNQACPNDGCAGTATATIVNTATGLPVATFPEPGTISMLGLAGLICLVRRRGVGA